MYLDILIFAIIAAFLVYRLNAVLGTRTGAERPRPNPFADNETQPAPVILPKPLAMPGQPRPPANLDALIDAAANTDGKIAEGLDEIAKADISFDAADFMSGARYAFEAVVTAFAHGDRDALRLLLSPKLFSDFAAAIETREAAGRTLETKIIGIRDARITEAHLGGTMAYITVAFDVEQTTVTRDKAGAIVEGDAKSAVTVEDVWTFTRDIRSSDPNWVLIETRAAEK